MKKLIKKIFTNPSKTTKTTIILWWILQFVVFAWFISQFYLGVPGVVIFKRWVFLALALHVGSEFLDNSKKEKKEMITCGIFLMDKYDRLLLVHPTGFPCDKWGIPKGLKDDDESDFFAAKREMKEETGIDINGLPIKSCEYMGYALYIHKNKTLSAYMVKIDMELPAKYLKCSSKFTSSNGQRLPEVDNHQWVHIDIALQAIQPEQKQLYLNYKLGKNEKI